MSIPEELVRIIPERSISSAYTLIDIAKERLIDNGMAPSVYVSSNSSGTLTLGIHYQPVGTLVGQTFHTDFNSCKNPATVIWIKE